AGEARAARRDQLEGVPGRGRGVALGEVSTQVGAQGPLRQTESLTELTVDGGWGGHVRLRFTRIDRCLPIISLWSGTCLLQDEPPSRSNRERLEANTDLPTPPLIGLLLRLAYQQYAQAT